MTAPIDLGNHDMPAGAGAAITPHDTNPLPFIPRGIYVGVSGDIVATMSDGAGGTVDLTFKSAPQGQVLPIRPSKVKATGTTATNLIAIQ